MLTVNTNPSTGVRYGTAYTRSLADWAFDEFFHYGTNLTYEAARKDFEQEFLAAYEGELDDLDEALDGFNEDYTGEEETYRLEKDGLELELSYLGGAPMVWVLKSPHTARVRLCSPDESGVEAYTLPPEWFEKD
jgi:hypothetical protein